MPSPPLDLRAHAAEYWQLRAAYEGFEAAEAQAKLLRTRAQHRIEQAQERLRAVCPEYDPMLQYRAHDGTLTLTPVGPGVAGD